LVGYDFIACQILRFFASSKIFP